MPLIRQARAHNWAPAETLQAAARQFIVAGLGSFVAYQCAHDLKGSALPAQPSDRMTWTYMGTGAIRGALRLCGLNLVSWVAGKSYVKPKDGIRFGTIKDSWIGSAVKELAHASDPT